MNKSTRHLSTLLALFTLFCAVLLFADNSFAAGRKTKVDRVIFDYDNDLINIYVTPGKAGIRPQYKYSSLKNNKFYIDILNSNITKNLDYKTKEGLVKRMKRNQFNSTTSRVVLEFRKNGLKPNVVYKSDPPRFVVDLHGGNGNEKDSPKESPTAKTTSKSGKKFKILIDPGHGGHDPGTLGKNGLKEKVVTLDIAKKLESQLKNRGDVIVKLTRKNDKFVSLGNRRKMAGDWDADLFISIHANGNSRTHVNQTEIYYYNKGSKALADIIKKDLVQDLKTIDGGTRKKPYVVIKNNQAKYGAVLVESDYLTNSRGAKNLGSTAYKNKIASSIYDSIETFLEKHQ